MSGKVDELDRQIVALLQRDGRMSNVDIAREVGVTEATIRKRLERLLSQGTICIVAIPDHVQLGFPVETIISLQVELGNLEQIVQSLAGMTNVRSVKITTGEYDVIFNAFFATDDELYQFLTEKIATIPGVRKTVTSHVLRETKDSSEWLLPQKKPSRILVVDDDPDFVEVARTVLESNGYIVNSAADGRETLEKMRQHPPNLVILDVMMRGILDSLEASEEIRRDKWLQHVPILYAGMFPTDSYVAVDNILSKPVDPAQILREVRRLLRQ